MNTSLLTWQGWVATLFIMVGTWIGTYWVIIRHRKVKSGVIATFSTPMDSKGG